MIQSSLNRATREGQSLQHINLLSEEIFHPNHGMLFLSSLRLHTYSRFGPHLPLLAQFDFSHSRLLLCPWDVNNDTKHHHALVEVIHQFNLTSSKNLS